MYAFDSQTSGAEFYRYTVDANGLTLVDGTTLNGMGGFQGGFQLANGLVYGGGGGIANPTTTPPSQIATLSTVDFYQAGISTYAAGIVADPSLQKEFLMAENLAGTQAYGWTDDLNTYLPEALLDMPASMSSSEGQWTMLRWGQDGLALLSSTENYVTDQTVSVVMLLSGPFVSPQLLQNNSAAVLTSSAALAHGSGNTILTLTGANLQPGVAVTWNGSYRTTTVVDAAHVTVAIPASDLTNAEQKPWWRQIPVPQRRIRCRSRSISGAPLPMFLVNPQQTSAGLSEQETYSRRAAGTAVVGILSPQLPVAPITPR